LNFDASINRLDFSFAKSQEDKDRKPTAKAYDHHDPQPNNTKVPNFNRQYKAQAHADPQNVKNCKYNGTPESMEVDPSFSKWLQPTHANGYQNRRNRKKLTSLRRMRKKRQEHMPPPPPKRNRK